MFDNKTIVINLLGGSGLGKSTTAAHLFAEMKYQGFDVELVREYVKNWAWEEKKIGIYDHIYILGKQAKSEYQLYGKVDYIITDSPLMLCGMYDKYYNGSEETFESVLQHMKKAEDNGVIFKNYLLTRNKPFNPKGRYETEEKAKEVDILVKNMLEQYNIEFTTLDCDDRERVNTILGVENANKV